MIIVIPTISKFIFCERKQINRHVSNISQGVKAVDGSKFEHPH